MKGFFFRVARVQERRYLKKMFTHLFEEDRSSKKTDRYGNSLLHLAILTNEWKRVADLLEKKIEVQEKNQFDLTPLACARFVGCCLDSSFAQEEEKNNLLIYRNLDRQLHAISGKELGKKVGIRYSNHLVFSCAADLLWVTKKCYQCLKKKKWKKENDWMKALHEKRLQKERTDHIYLRWIDSYLGYGIFAAKDLPELTLIGEYTGRVLLRNRKNSRQNDYIFGYMIGPKDSPLIIDAREEGNLTRFINHSIEPNLLSRWMIVEGVTRIIFFTKKRISKGTQLTYDYGGYYWKKRSDPLVL